MACNCDSYFRNLEARTQYNRLVPFRWTLYTFQLPYDPDAAEELNGDEDPSNDDLTKGNSPYTIYINWLTEYGYDIPTN